MKDVAFGQYYPVDSFVHKLDPRLKLLFLAAYITSVFLARNFWGIGLCALVMIAVILSSRVPIHKVLRAVRGVVILIAVTSVIYIFFYDGEGEPLWSWGVFAVYREGIYFALFLVLRLFLLVTCSSMLTYTTTPVALTDGIESIFRVHVVALVMSIALRMIPELTGEVERIKNAQKARGADFESGGLIRRVRALVPILIPLLISSFRIAGDLAEAMDARCYMAGKKRIKYKKLAFGPRDLVGFLVGAALVTGVVLLNVYMGSVF